LASYVIRVARTATIAALFVITAMLGALSGVMLAYSGDLPEISALDNYNPSTITRVYASGGEVLGEFAVQRRLVVGYDDISPRLREAIIAAEDGEFNSHFGLSISRIIVTLARDVVYRRLDNPAGASTLTQQLARNLFPIGFQKSLERKVKEAILAIQIEKRYTKPEILTFYCNQIHFGHGTNGVESASRLYFSKSARDLTLEEAALIAGIIQSPARQSPYVDMNAARRRRNYVLQRMADERNITQAEADAAKASPIIVRGQPQPERTIAPFFLEEVRKQLERDYGAKALYESGLSVQTTLDMTLQEAANRALQSGLRRIDKRRGFRRPRRNLVVDAVNLDTFKDDRWNRPMRVGDVVPAVVMGIGKPAPANGARLRIGRYEADLTREGFSWTRRAAASDILKPGDLIEVELTALDDEKSVASVRLEQTPQVEGALVAIDNRTGQIKAMVGGWDFGRSKFNRAVQAYRQLGSTFKPLVYTAAIDRGFTPASILTDEPTSWVAGPNQPLYQPQNYDHMFEGPITLRRALEDSRNVPAVKMMETLGPQQVLGYAKRFGFEEDFPPYLPIALGAGEATLLEVTSAYSVFPNQGVRMKPLTITKVLDRERNLLAEMRAEPSDVIRADTAYVMTSLLRGVVQRGTAAAAASIDWPLAGKTGTVDDNTDAWFIGFDPFITVGVWTGLDEKKPIGGNETGAVAALPIWIDFMRAYIAARPDTETPPRFDPPGNIVFLPIDKRTGLPPTTEDGGTISEAFIAGTQPGGLTATP
jgi:penicillin-binding protein 1A